MFNLPLDSMMRSKTASSMQKTYDDCYLICSTAIYFESQVGAGLRDENMLIDLMVG